jgi:acyl carrier protein
MDSTDSQETRTQILTYLKKICGGTPKGNDSLSLIGIDSVAMAELTFELEKRFAIRIDDDILDIDTVDELISYVVARQSAMTN